MKWDNMAFQAFHRIPSGRSGVTAERVRRTMRVLLLERSSVTATRRRGEAGERGLRAVRGFEAPPPTPLGSGPRKDKDTPGQSRRIVRATAGAMAMLTFGVSEAHAAPTARLVYVREAGTETCPDEGSVRAAVAARLGYDPFFSVAESTLVADVTGVGKAFRVRIRLVDAAQMLRGKREFRHEGAQCSDAIDAMALSMSLAIDPESLQRPPAEPPSAAAASPGATVASEPSPAAVAPPPPPDRAPAPVTPPVSPQGSGQPSRAPWHLLAGAGGAFWFGTGPSPHSGVQAHVQVRLRKASLAAEGRLDLPSSARVGPGTVETSLTAGSVVPCMHWGPVATCANGTFGSVSASARSIARPSSDTGLYAAVGPRIAAELFVTESLRLLVRADVLVALHRYDLRMDDAPVYRAPPISVGAATGLAWKFF